MSRSRWAQAEAVEAMREAGRPVTYAEVASATGRTLLAADQLLRMMLLRGVVRVATPGKSGPKGYLQTYELTDER